MSLLKNSITFLLLLEQNQRKKSPTLKKNKKNQYFFTSYNEKMRLGERKFDEFEEAFKSLKQSKAAGFDDLSRNIY